MAEDLLENGTAVSGEYNAAEIQVLEGLEAVRKRPRYVHRLHLHQRPASPGL